jgi:maleylpyruvate isomerase
MTDSLRRLDPGDDLLASSRLPGWSRAHTLVDIARNADGLRNLLLAARTGLEIKMYTSPLARRADIEAGATRPGEVILADVLESAHRFLVEAQAMPEASWSTVVAFTSGGINPPMIPASRLPEMRLEEVEVHHVDLAIGYEFSNTPDTVADRLITNFARRRISQGVAFGLELEDPDQAIELEAPLDDQPFAAQGQRCSLGWPVGRRPDLGRAQWIAPGAATIRVLLTLRAACYPNRLHSS